MIVFKHFPNPQSENPKPVQDSTTFTLEDALAFTHIGHNHLLIFPQIDLALSLNFDPLCQMPHESYQSQISKRQSKLNKRRIFCIVLSYLK